MKSEASTAKRPKSNLEHQAEAGLSTDQKEYELG